MLLRYPALSCTTRFRDAAWIITPARRNARSDPPPHRGRRARPNSRVPCLRLGSLPRFSAEIGSSTPPLSSPGLPRIPPSRPLDLPRSLLFHLQNHIQNFIRFLIAFWLPKWCQKPPKMMPKLKKNACFFQVCFHTVFSSILKGFLVAFPGARPSICMVFTMNSWRAPFFAKSEKVAKMTSQSEPK